MTTLETERLILRPFEPGDLDDFHRILGCKSVSEMLNVMPWPLSRAEAAANLDRKLKANRGNDRFNYAITLKSSRQMIGGIDVARLEDKSSGGTGYWLDEIWWHQGYAGEAAKRFVRFCFEGAGLTRLETGYFTENIASGRILERLGFQITGQSTEHSEMSRQDVQLIEVELLKTDWEAAHDNA